jgi:hypothetical protein
MTMPQSTNIIQLIGVACAVDGGDVHGSIYGWNEVK